MPSSCFCEAVRSHGIAQPANTWSSLAFVVVAVVVLAQLAQEKKRADATPANRFNSRPAYPLLFAFAMLVVGLGSAFYHARLTFTGQFVDVLGMYFVATFALIYSFDRVRRLSIGAVIAAYLGLNAALAAILWWLPVVRRFVFGLLIVAVLATEALGRTKHDKPQSPQLLIIAVLVLGVAFGIWILDYVRIVCSPESLVQGHAVWHILGAIASWFLYRYYREAAI